MHMSIEIGQPAPQINIPNQNNQLVQLDSYLGNWVILYFYPKDNTPGCTTQASEFSFREKEFNALGAKIIGVSPDSIESHKNFIQKQNLSLTLLSDPTRNTLNAYGAWGLKTNYGKTYNGVIRSTFIIDPKGNIALALKNVRAKGHVDRVFFKLKGLVGGTPTKLQKISVKTA